MPGELKPDAKCPLCEEPLAALIDERTSEGVNRVYYHGKTSARRRRSLPCKQYFTSYWRADEERAGLEL